MPPTRIYKLTNNADAARFNLSPQEAARLRTFCFPNRWDPTNRVQGRIEVLVGHIQAGITRGSLNWWLYGKTWNGRPIQASSNVMTQQDGSLLEVIDPQHGPWTNGDRNKPTARAAEVLKRGGNPNVWSWTLEAEGQPWTTFTPEHWETICWAFDDQLKKNPHLDPRTDILAHGDLNSVDKSQCGLYVPRLIAELIGDHRPSLDRIGTITKYASPITVKVTASAGLNIRQWGELDAQVIDYAPAGATLIAAAHVIGTSVDGINEWYIDATGRRYWSGGTNRPNLT